MIVILEPDLGGQEATVAQVRAVAARYPGVTVRPYEFKGTTHRFAEVHLLGPTAGVPAEAFAQLPGVRQVVRVSAKYRLIGRHGRSAETVGFEHNGVRIDDTAVHVFAGLCAVDTPAHVDAMMAALAREGVVTTRMGAYKPRSSPYDFQGLGKGCLPWVFEAAGRHGIKLIAMEATDAAHLDEIWDALERAGHPTGVMVQIGTRNAQNYELLKQVGRQQEFPVLFKRGMGITLEESLNACEYVASEGNARIVFCLRGVKSHLGEPHRNLVDFAHVPVVRRQTRLPVCIDPSHSVGTGLRAPDGLPDVFHATAQGVVAGASAVLVDFHPHPECALCDGGQALTLDMLGPLLDHVRRVRAAYEGSAAAFGRTPVRAASP
ncbi:MAG: 3-deoxy-7-phosphoheptulonate synthase [Acidobacteria bacterium]|nr:MAG: 3-deoxy-7-phosphoheptulonate synthase [Acidobacteriota bacterium]